MKLLTGIAVVVIALFLSFSVSYSQNTAEESWLKGVELGAQGKFTEAKKEFEKALKDDPFSTPAESGLAVIEDVIGKKIKKESAINLFKGVIYHYKKELDKAIIKLSKAIEIGSRNAMAYNDRGNVYYAKGQYDKAISDYNKAIEINPKFAAAYINRGYAYYYKGQYDQAISDYNKAIEINPMLAIAYYNRGNAYNMKGQYDQAIFDYSKAIEINPKFAIAYNNRAISYYYKKAYSWAWDDVYKAQILGYQVHPEVIKELRKASGRQK